MSGSREVALYIDPPSHHFLNDRLFTLFEGRYYSTLNRSCVYVRDLCASRGIPVHTADLLAQRPDAARTLYVSLGRLGDYRALSRRPGTVLSAYFAVECPIVVPSLYRELNTAQHYFKRVFSWGDSAELERFVGGPLRCEPFCWPMAYEGIDEAVWGRTERGFLVMINTNKLPRLPWRELYSERLRAVEFFSRTEEIDLYGIGWDVPSYRVGEYWMPYALQRVQRALLHRWHRVRPDPLLEAARRVYRGPADSKLETLSRYTFALCFENMMLKGWITEKVFDCFFAGTIPVYWGATDVEAHIPADCFIDMRRFAGYDELRGFLRSLSPAEIRTYRESARQYLLSPQFRHAYTKEAFAGLFSRFLEEDAGISISDNTQLLER